jgi:hypothetical protein
MMENQPSASGGGWDSLPVLVITASLTTLIFPLVMLIFNYKKEQRQKNFENELARRQKQFDADIAREMKLVEDQIKLSEELARLVWEYQFLCLKVSYYQQMPEDGPKKDGPKKEEPKYTKACEAFDANSWTLLSQIRTEVSKAKRLTTPGVYQTLNDFYNWLNGVDTELSMLVQPDAVQSENAERRKKQAPQYASLTDAVERWELFHKTLFYDGGREIDETLAVLAADMGLAREGGAAPKPRARFLEMIEQRLKKKKGRSAEGARGEVGGVPAEPTLLPESSLQGSGVTAADAAGRVPSGHV